MDIQDKLIVKYLTQGREKEIELNTNLEGEILFNFNEHEELGLLVESKNYKVIIECFSVKTKDKAKDVKDNKLSLNNKTCYIINDFKIKGLGYNPGIYFINIVSKQREITSYFEVKTNDHVSILALDKIKKELEDFKKGITYSNARKGKVKVVINDDLNLKYLLANWDLLKINLREKENKEVLKTIYKYQNYPLKSNFKSIKKSLLKPSTKYLNVSKGLFLTKSNTTLYKDKIMAILNHYLDIINEYINIDESYLESLNLELLNIKNNNNDFVSINHQNALKNINNNIENQTIKLNNRKNDLNKLKEIIKYFNDYNNFNELDLMNLYNRLNKTNEIDLGLKLSSILFELYGFVIINKLFINLGFNFINNDEVKKSYSLEGLELYYVKNEYKIVVTYENFIKHYIETNNSLATVFSTRNKPDYTIVFYKNDKFLTSLILEMKYRNINYLMVNDDISNIIDNYAMLVFKEDDKISRSAVDEVIIINPDKEERKISSGIAGKIMGFNVDKDLEDTKCFKYLKEKIKGLLK